MTVICCNQCFENIAKKDTKAARLWLDLCSYRAKVSSNFFLKEWMVPEEVPSILNLEILGFISTLDAKEGVCVRVEGYESMSFCSSLSCSVCIDTFCIEREGHGSDWQ